ncbi:glutamate-cysteine ligase family protein [Cryobacterium sp. N21]|uniref:carboxylate-amine ligase n=1 Tax=Cryobacterium sp. N21 TaxID=2048289 RepID=UPI000CE4BF68|nr:glutamate-cysteine ligase family protein [Cryobacterium sp. N21]
MLAFRSRLARAAVARGVLAAGVGAPFQTEGWPEVTDVERYHTVETEFRGLVPDHLINGLHVHVGIPSRDAGVQALNRVRVWLPTLLALAVNSPFWHGADTDFSSWRSVHMRRWSTIGTLESALIVTDELLRYAGDAIDEVGNRERIVGLLARARRLGTGAERQRAAMRSGGQPALAALLRQALTAHD